jgi:hypothetical protein
MEYYRISVPIHINILYQCVLIVKLLQVAIVQCLTHRNNPVILLNPVISCVKKKKKEEKKLVLFTVYTHTVIQDLLKSEYYASLTPSITLL